MAEAVDRATTPLLARWAEEALGAALPDEPESSCADCVMCTPGPAPRFRPDVKCCMYLPALKNFQVGLALRDEAGRRSTRPRLADPQNVTPLGLTRGDAQVAPLRQALAEGRFGQAPALVCPHFDAAEGGRCTIWAARDAVCATWFCRVSRGARGRGAWHELHHLLSEIEELVARQLAQRLGELPAAEPTWGPWAGQVEAYYLRCAELAEAITWEELRRLGGFGLRFRQRNAREAQRAREVFEPIVWDVPGTWAVGAARVQRGEDGLVYAYGDGPYSPVALTEAQWAAAQVGGGAALDEALARRLVDHHVWVAP
ncbi:hypothetical protein L6R49_27540 [Myxococcota bacterium]|nr:hypothetical protein [Myxococcota bacterium]